MSKITTVFHNFLFLLRIAVKGRRVKKHCFIEWTAQTTVSLIHSEKRLLIKIKAIWQIRWVMSDSTAYITKTASVVHNWPPTRIQNNYRQHLSSYNNNKAVTAMKRLLRSLAICRDRPYGTYHRQQENCRLGSTWDPSVRRCAQVLCSLSDCFRTESRHGFCCPEE